MTSKDGVCVCGVGGGGGAVNVSCPDHRLLPPCLTSCKGVPRGGGGGVGRGTGMGRKGGGEGGVVVVVVPSYLKLKAVQTSCKRSSSVELVGDVPGRVFHTFFFLLPRLIPFMALSVVVVVDVVVVVVTAFGS